MKGTGNLKTFNQRFFLILCVWVLVNGKAWAQVQVQAQVDTSRPIYTASLFTYQIIVTNGGQSNADMSPLAQYNPSGPSMRSQTSIVNGRSSSYRILSYQMTAPTEGEHTIPSVAVDVDGKKYQTNPVNIKVVKPGTTKQMDVGVKLSAKKCYVGQPVVLTLSFYIWTDIVQAKQVANISIQIPFLDDNLFFMEDINSPPGGMKQAVLPVNGQEEYIYQKQVKYDGVDCVQVQFIKVLIPKKDGLLQLPAASVSADLAVSQKRRSRDPFFDDFFSPRYEYKRFAVQSERLTLDVKALPQEGKPADFYGLVGDYKIHTEAMPTQVNVGDPITFKILISGSRYLKPVQWPNLEHIPEMHESFKVPTEYADGEIKDGAKVFTQTIRANTDTITQVPPIPLSFFDAKTGQYRTIYSKPIPLEVSPTRVVTDSDVESHMPPSSVAKQVKAIKEGISANYLSADALTNQHFSVMSAITSPIFVILWVIPVATLIGSSIARLIHAGGPQRQIANKCKKAYAHAIKQIRHAEKQDQPAQQISAALKQYIADKFNKITGSLTWQECKTILLAETQNHILSEKFQELIEQVEVSEYSPMSFELTSEKQAEICKLLAEIEKSVR